MEDIKDLAMYHVARVCEKSRIMMKGFSPDFFEVLGTYHWPGNIRELFHTVESALVASFNEPILYPTHLPVNIRTSAARASLGKGGNSPAQDVPTSQNDIPNESLPLFKTYRTRLLEAGEKRYFRDIVSKTRGDIPEACRLSGLSRSRLYHFLKKYDISI